jgi:hypothetical protein
VTAPTLTDALREARRSLPPSWRTCQDLAAEVLRLLAADECPPDLQAAITEAVAARPERYGGTVLAPRTVHIGRQYDHFEGDWRPGTSVVVRFARRGAVE